MPIYLTHKTALEIWRIWSSRHSLSLEQFHTAQNLVDPPAKMLPSAFAVRKPIVGEGAVKVLEAASLSSQLRKLLAAETIHLLGMKSSSCRQLGATAVHKCYGEYPRLSFLKMTEGVYVASPELVYAQLAACLPFGSLVALGDELCGCYPADPSDSGSRVRYPLSSVSNMVAFCGAVGSVAGIDKARKAARLLSQRCASVMESEVRSVLALPYRHGGYGLWQGMLLNYRINLDGDRDQCRCPYVVADICWPEKKVVVEYDGRASHLSPYRQTADSRKKETLVRVGWRVFTVTHPQFSGVTEFDEMAREIAKALGKRVRIRDEEFFAHQYKLRQEMRAFHQGAVWQSSVGE